MGPGLRREDAKWFAVPRDPHPISSPALSAGVTGITGYHTDIACAILKRTLRHMSDERGETIDLVYIGRALQRLKTEVASLRDEMKVLIAILLRHEETLIRGLEQMRVMVAQNARILDGLRAGDRR